MNIRNPHELHDIFVRAHTVVSQKVGPQRPIPAKWPKEILVIDTETTTDTRQILNFGVYRRCRLVGSQYECIEEGLFHADDLEIASVRVLDAFVKDPKNTPRLDVKVFPPPMRLNLYRRTDFVERVFWKTIRKGGMVVAFNLSFDLSRLAIRSCSADDGGWSLVLSLRASSKTGQIEPNPERPRIIINSKDSKLAFFGLGSILHPNEWPEENRFLDLRTLGWALRNESYNLNGACKAFGVPGKVNHKPTGRVTAAETKYCRADVRATTDLLNAMKKEFDQHPFGLRPDRAYSPASIAKSYLDVMNIARPKEIFNVANKELGIAMQGYYGGRAEVRIRKTPVPVVLTDFTSQYPTVNALLGNWNVLTAESVTFDDCTTEVQEMLGRLDLKQAFNREFWKELSFFALVLPQDDIFPVRAIYNGRTQNIGLNYLTPEQPLWFAGPDVIASALQTGRPPHILKAIRMVPHGRQSGLVPTNLAGMVAINPVEDDFFCHVIEQKSLHKKTNKPLSQTLKVTGNSGSYGLFVEMNQEKVRKPENVRVFSGEISFERPYAIIEKTGKWYFPPLASLITAGGRLLLAMLERCVRDAGGTYLFCDTDSLCVVSNEHGGLVPCEGGQFELEGRDAVNAISWNRVYEIANRFNRLNPYKKKLVHEILKVEDVNFVGSDPGKPRRQLFGYAVSAKRYVLYEQDGSDISIVKASGHGLGYLFPPKRGFREDVGASAWVVEAWEWL